MKKFLVLTTVFVFAGISFAQQTQSGSSQEQYPIGGGKKYKKWWCSQNWEKCKQMKLEDLSAKKECLEKSQSYQAYKECEFMRKHGRSLR